MTRRNGDPVYALDQGAYGPVWRRFNKNKREFATTEMTNTTLPPVVEVLLAAADIIEVDGWHQGSLFGPAKEGGPRPCCAIGAVARAENFLNVTDFGAGQALNKAANKLADTQKARINGLISTAYFNDHVAESANEVTALLRATASEIYEKGLFT